MGQRLDVQTHTKIDRGYIIYHAYHPELPLVAAIQFSADPIRWPEPDPEEILRTTPAQAETTAVGILDALASGPLSSAFSIPPIPDGPAPTAFLAIMDGEKIVEVESVSGSQTVIWDFGPMFDAGDYSESRPVVSRDRLRRLGQRGDVRAQK